MDDTLPVCPKCGTAMERGHVPDAAHGMIIQSRWSRGDPEPRRFIGGIKWDEDDQIPIVAYRCSGCGYLELYAPPA